MLASALPPRFLDKVKGAVLAPMSGVTDAGFRRAAQRFGASLVVSEMVASDDLVRGKADAILRMEGEGISTHVVQLAGCEAHWMGEAAKVAEAGGADIIDINMGCPAKRVTNGWSGSALMRDLDHACHLIAATVAATKRPVTLKMRLGWDDASLNAPELARRAEALGIRMITVHGRTRCQFYKGHARWGLVRETVNATRLPVIVNGDILCLSHACEALALSGAAAVMIGRGALGRPWLIGEVAAGLKGESWHAPSSLEMTDAAICHYQFLLSRFGVSMGLRHARKHVVAYLDEAARQGSESAAMLRQDLCNADDPNRVIAGLEQAFRDIPDRKAA
jgi:tRNA-dihydrouridine synthase B